eukprot:25782-Pelagococcus_subviridis.AAC.1
MSLSSSPPSPGGVKAPTRRGQSNVSPVKRTPKGKRGRGKSKVLKERRALRERGRTGSSLTASAAEDGLDVHAVGQLAAVRVFVRLVAPREVYPLQRLIRLLRSSATSPPRRRRRLRLRLRVG